MGVLYALIYLWALWNYGATQDEVLYRLFLLSLPLVVILGLTLSSGYLRRPRIAALVMLGAFLFVQSARLPTLAARGYIQMACVWSAFFLALGLATQARLWQRAIWLFLVGVGALQAALGLGQALGVIGDAAGAVAQPAEAHGTLFNRNHFSGLLNLTLPLALGLVYASFSRRARQGTGEAYAFAWIAGLCLSLMGVAIFLSRSRAGSLIVVLTLASMTLLWTFRQRGSDRRSLPATAGWLVLLLVLTVGMAVGIRPLIDRFRQPEPVLRLALYRDTLGLIRDHPFRGVGPGMYRWRFRPYQTENGNLRYNHAHNDYLESAADWGLPLSVLFWVFLVYRMTRAAMIFLSSESTWIQGLALGSAGAIFSILTHSLVDFNLQIPSVAVTFFMIVALSWSLEECFSHSAGRADS